MRRFFSALLPLFVTFAYWAEGRIALAQEASQGAPTEVQAPTRATFVSTTSEQWDVMVDGQQVCGTPCTGPLSPHQVVTLYSQDNRPVVLDVGRLPAGDLLVSATPHRRGMYAGGIVATTLGGMALATGITLLAVGIAKDKDGMTTAGLIAGGAGLLTVPGGIYLMFKALPNARIEPASNRDTVAVVGVRGMF